MTGQRARFCRCCEGPASGPYCDPCHDHAVRHARLVADTITALWGSDGLQRYQIELRRRRLAASRTPSRRTA